MTKERVRVRVRGDGPSRKSLSSLKITFLSKLIAFQVSFDPF